MWQVQVTHMLLWLCKVYGADMVLLLAVNDGRLCMWSRTTVQLGRQQMQEQNDKPNAPVELRATTSSAAVARWKWAGK